MKPSDRKAFVQLITDVLGYYKQAVSDFTLRVWHQAMLPFEMEQISKAMTAHVTDPDRGQFAPKVADIVRVLHGTRTDRATVAWSKAFAAMSDVGAYSDVVFDDAAIHAVIQDLGGWPKFCRHKLDEMSYLQHRFCEAYKTYAAHGTSEHQRFLMGDRSPDSEYERRGLPIPRPVLVGDPTECRTVYLAGGSSAKPRVYMPHDVLRIGRAA